MELVHFSLWRLWFWRSIRSCQL